MKKIIFISVITLLLISNIHGQTQRGTLLVGASSDMRFLSHNEKHRYFSGNRIITDESDNSDFELKTNLGFFFIDNLVIGISPDYYTTDDDNSTFSRFKFGPFTRYYFGYTNVRPFIGGQLGLSTSKDRGKNTSYTTTFNGSYIGINGGIAFFVTKNIALEGLVDYTGSYEGIHDNSTTNEYRDRYLTLYFGFSLHF